MKRRRITIEVDANTLSAEQMDLLGEAMARLTILARSQAISLKTSAIRTDIGTGRGGLMPGEAKVLDYMKRQGSRILTVPELVRALGLTDVAVRSYLHYLKKRRLVTAFPESVAGGFGTRKLTGWSIMPDAA